MEKEYFKFVCLENWYLKIPIPFFLIFILKCGFEHLTTSLKDQTTKQAETSLILHTLYKKITSIIFM